MTAVSLIGTPTVDSGDKNSFTLAAPSGLASGDHQLIVGTVGTGSETWGTTPTGFTLAWDSGSIGGADTFRVVIYISNSSTQTGSVVCGKSGTRHGHFVRAAWRGGTGFDLTTDANNVTASGTTHALPSQTTSGTDNTTVGVGVIDTGPPGGTNAWTKPAAWDNEVYDATTHGAQPEDISIGIFSEVTAATATAVTGSATSTLTDVAAVWSARLAGFSGATVPTVSAGADATINAGSSFSRTATENDNGSAITAREWKVQAGPDSVGNVIGTAAALSNWFPNWSGVYTLRYTATNGVGSNSDDVLVTVVAQTPLVGAGADATITLGDTFNRVATENARGSGITNREWVVISAPVGGPAADTILDGDTSLSYVPPVSGTYVLRYRAYNAIGEGNDDLTLTVNLGAPTANAGADLVIPLGDSINRNGTHTGFQITSYEWAVTAGPSHVGTVLSTSPGLSWTPPAIGTYTLRFRVVNPAGTGEDFVNVQTTAVTPPDDPPDDGWTYVNIPWGDNEFTVRDLPPGVEFEFQIRAQDNANPPNRSPYSASAFAETPVDDIAPSIPAAPEVAASRNAVQVLHRLGKSTGGTSNLESDIVGLRVYLLEGPADATDTVAVEEGGTSLGQIDANSGHLAAGVPVVATFAIPQVEEVWIKVTAVDAYGNESLPSAAAPVTAELLTDAYIGNLTVTKVTSGTILSDWVQAAEINTGEIGSRVRFGYFGIELYNDLNEVVLDANTSDGSLFLAGTLSTSPTGRRVELDGDENEMRFYPQDTDTRYGRLFSFIPTNHPDDIAIELRANDSDTVDYIGRLTVSPDESELLISPQGTNGSRLAKTNVSVNPENVILVAGTLEGAAPWEDGDSRTRSRIILREDEEIELATYTHAEERSSFMIMEPGGIRLRVQEEALSIGGQLILGRPGGNSTSLGTIDEGADINSYIWFPDGSGDIYIATDNTNRLHVDSGGDVTVFNDLTADAFRGSGSSGRAYIGAGDGIDVAFQWSGGNLFLVQASSGTTILNIASVNTLLGANIINRLNTAETNISTLFTYAHSH